MSIFCTWIQFEEFFFFREAFLVDKMKKIADWGDTNLKKPYSWRQIKLGFYINISNRYSDKAIRTITNEVFSSNSGACDVPNFVTIKEDASGE